MWLSYAETTTELADLKLGSTLTINDVIQLQTRAAPGASNQAQTGQTPDTHSIIYYRQKNANNDNWNAGNVKFICVQVKLLNHSITIILVITFNKMEYLLIINN